MKYNKTYFYFGSYSLKDTINNKFQIFPTTGRISTAGRLDREETSQYTLEVIAQDMSVLPLSTTTTVIVYVDDINDNAPQFDRTEYTQRVAPPVSAGTETAKTHYNNKL